MWPVLTLRALGSEAPRRNRVRVAGVWSVSWPCTVATVLLPHKRLTCGAPPPRTVGRPGAVRALLEANPGSEPAAGNQAPEAGDGRPAGGPALPVRRVWGKATPLPPGRPSAVSLQGPVAAGRTQSFGFPFAAGFVRHFYFYVPFTASWRRREEACVGSPRAFPSRAAPTPPRGCWNRGPRVTFLL